MNEFAFTLICLSAPGFLFQICFDLVSRVRQRRARDLFGAVGWLFLLSSLLSTATYFIVGWFDPAGAAPVIEQYVLRPLIPWKTTPFVQDDQLVRSIVIVVTTLTTTSAIAGILVGKLHVWGVLRGLARRSVIDDLVRGVRPPAIYATVVSSTQIGSAQLVYRGALAAIQMSPEGNIECLALAQAEKSTLTIGARLKHARTTKPFIKVNATPDTPVVRDRLVIESEDIANVYFDVSSGTGRGDPLDFLAYAISFLADKIYKAGRRLVSSSA